MAYTYRMKTTEQSLHDIDARLEDIDQALEDLEPRSHLPTILLDLAAIGLFLAVLVVKT